MPISTNTRTDDTCLELVIYAIVLIVLGLGVRAWSGYSCSVQTQDMGFDHRYSWVAGCQIEVEEGKWIPLDSYYFKEE